MTKVSFTSFFNYRRNPKRTDLVLAEQGPAEVPGLCGSLGLGQPFLGHILMLHGRIKVKLVESLKRTKEQK